MSKDHQWYKFAHDTIKLAHMLVYYKQNKQSLSSAVIVTRYGCAELCKSQKLEVGLAQDFDAAGVV